MSKSVWQKIPKNMQVHGNVELRRQDCQIRGIFRPLQGHECAIDRGHSNLCIILFRK